MRLRVSKTIHRNLAVREAQLSILTFERHSSTVTAQILQTAWVVTLESLIDRVEAACLWAGEGKQAREKDQSNEWQRVPGSRPSDE